MDIQLTNWGNSLGMRIPSALSKQLGLKKGTRMHIEVKRGKLIISPAADDVFERAKAIAKEVNLRALLKNINPRDLQPIEDWGPPVGKEIW